MPAYLDNKDFQRRLTEYLTSCEEAEAEGKEVPVVPRQIAIDLQNIAHGLASSARFNRFPYAEDMAREGVYKCLLKIRNYDFRKYTNPLAYFTQICWFDFIEFDKKEYHENLAVQAKCEEMAVDVFNLGADDVDARNEHLEFIRQKFDQREMNRTNSDKEGKFVHRMKTQRPKKEAPKKNTLSFLYEKKS